MKHTAITAIKIGLFALIILFWQWIYAAPLSGTASAAIIIGGILLVFPVSWLGRQALDREATLQNSGHTTRITTVVHYTLIILFGSAIARALATHTGWHGPILPVPRQIGWLLVVICASFTLLTVLNLAVKALGAPFAIALSRRLTSGWLYARTRNPMVLGTLATLVALGIFFQSWLFTAWSLLLFSPALLYFVHTYEERELELRFGQPYLEYRARTPFLFPYKPKR